VFHQFKSYLQRNTNKIKRHQNPILSRASLPCLFTSEINSFTIVNKNLQLQSTAPTVHQLTLAGSSSS